MKSIPRVQRVRGTITTPPSKSYTARALLLSAMSEGPTTIDNALDSDDSRYMLEAIRTIGFEVSGAFGSAITIGDRKSISANEVEIFVGNAGTAMRFLAGFLSFTPGRFLLKGEDRMHQRPIGDLADVLLSIGVEVEYVGAEGYPPLRIRGKKMRGGQEVRISGSVSSQFVSSLMMAGATLPGGMTIDVENASSQPYIEVTADILRHFGATVDSRGGAIRVSATRLKRDRYRVEGDYSSASYWFAAAAATAGTVTVTGLRRDSVQGDRSFLEILHAMGCEVAIGESDVALTGPERLRGGAFDCNATPDIVPTLAAIAPLASSRVEITNVANLRLKESDRLSSVSAELRKLGASVEERAGSLTIEPGWTSDPAIIDPHGDHRLAMSFAIAGLARGGVSIASDHVVSKSYPGFWRTLGELVRSSS
jgi:3-phosphoshikimate 1-carboxyvinyltransferase